MDDTDRRLLLELRANARATYAELGRAVGLSPPSAHDRVAKLEATGVIAGYHAALAPAEVGLGVTALVGILPSDQADQDEVAVRLEQLPQIEDCWLVTGEEAFLVKVRLPDVEGLERLLATLRRVPGVLRTRTTLVLSTRFEGRVPLTSPPVAAEPG